DEHFTVDGTLIEAWANRRSFSREEGSTGTGQRVRREEIVAGHARKRNGSGRAAIQEEPGGRSQTELSRTRADGKQEWVNRAGLRNPVGGPGGARCGIRNVANDCAEAARRRNGGIHHARRGQSVPGRKVH